MPNTILVEDSFATLISGAALSGRVPPTTNSGATWQADVGAVGGGSGDVKMSGNGGSCKQSCLVENNAVRVTWNDGGASEDLSLFVRHGHATLVYPNYGYMVRFRPRTNGDFWVARIDNYSTVILGSAVPWTYNTTGDYVCAFECAGNTMRVIINGVLAHTFEEFTYPAGAGANRYRSGFVLSTDGGLTRIKHFQILDSIVIESEETPYRVAEIF